MGCRPRALVFALLLLLPVVLVAPPSAPTASAQGEPLPARVPALWDAIEAEGETVVLVALRLDAPPAALDDVLLRLTRLGARDLLPLRSVGAFAATVDAEGLRALERDGRVQALGVAPDAQPASLLAQTASTGGAGAASDPWWLGQMTGVRALHERGIRGAGGVVAVVDTGVNGADPLFSATYGGAWLDTMGAAAAPVDDCGHGSSALSMVVHPEHGVAPQAKWVAARVGAQWNSCAIDVEKALNAWDWILGLTGSAKPHVVVNSWGYPETGETRILRGEAANVVFLRFLDAFAKKDILPLFAAGRDNYEPLFVPADYLQAVAVGMVDASGRANGPDGPGIHDVNGNVIPRATSPHKKPDLSAPGEAVTVRNHQGADVSATGSSYATPFAAGVALLAKGEHATLDAARLRNVLLAASNIRPWTTLGVDSGRPNNEVGHGILNAEQALLFAARDSRVLVLGDATASIGAKPLLQDVLERGGYDVTHLGTDALAVADALHLLPTHGTLVLGNLDKQVRVVQDLLKAAETQGTGIVLVGDPRHGAPGHDGLDEYFDLLREQGLAPAKAEGRQQGDLVGAYVGAPGSITIRTHASGPFKGATYPAAAKVASTVVSPDGAGTFFATRAPEGARLSRVALLANAGGSGSAVAQVTPETKQAIVDAVGWARAAAIDPHSVPPAVKVLDAEVVVVGDPTGQLVELARLQGFRADAIDGHDLTSVLRTLEAESNRRAAPTPEKRVRLLVYNDVVAQETQPFGATALPQVEAARAPGSGLESVSVLVLGGKDRGALDLLQATVGHAVSTEASAGPTRTGLPHWMNGFTPPTTPTPLEASQRVFTVPAQGWTSVYTRTDANGVSDRLHVGAANAQPGDRRAVLAVGVGAEGKALDDAEAAAIRRAISWGAMEPVSVSSPIVWVGDISVASHPLVRRETWGGQTWHVLNGVDASAPLVVKDVSLNLRISNGLFTGAGNGIVLENVQGGVEVVGNQFRGLQHALTVQGSPNVRIHHNAFVDNEWALRYNESVPAVPAPEGAAASTRLMVDASLNYFNQTSAPTLAGMEGSSPQTWAQGWAPWASQYASSHVCDLTAPAGCPSGPNNAIEPGYLVLPVYTQPDYSETFPCVDVRPTPVLSYLGVPNSPNRALQPLVNQGVGAARGYLEDTGNQTWAQCWTLSTTTLSMSTSADNQFGLAATGASTLVGNAVPAPAGWGGDALALAPGASLLKVSSASGRGAYQLWQDAPLPAPMTTLLQSGFATSTLAGWTLAGPASQVATAGRNGDPGVLRASAGGVASAPVNADPYDLSVAVHVRPSADGAGYVALDRPLASGGAWPLVNLSVGPAGVGGQGWILKGQDAAMPAGSWHKVEIRLAPPRADVYVDNAFVGSLQMAAAPIAPGLALPLRASLGATAGSLDYDDLLVFDGDSVATLQKELDFEDGDERELTLYANEAGDDAIALVGDGSSKTSAPARWVQTLDGNPNAVDLSAFAVAAGSPSYASGNSVYLRSDGNSASARLALGAPLRHYELEQYVSIPRDQAFARFTLLRLEDAAGATLAEVRLEDNNTYLDVFAARNLSNVAQIKPGAWHKLGVVVNEDELLVVLDDRVVVEERMRHAAPPASWFVGEGLGSIMLDNVRFGQSGLVDADASDGAAIDPDWTVKVTSTGTGAVHAVAEVPVLRLVGDKVENALLGSHTLRVYAPTLEASHNYMERRVSLAPKDAHVMRMRYYLPEKNPLTPPGDAFHVFRLDPPTGSPLYSLLLDTGDVLQAAAYSRSGSRVTTTLDVAFASRGVWHEVVAVVLPTGEITVSIDGKPVPGLSASLSGGVLPGRLIVGDTIAQNNPLKPGMSGSGEVYVDDLSIVKLNRPPNVWIDAPKPATSMGGLATFQGRAQDPDEHDAVQRVDLTMRTSGLVQVHGPARADGTTSWTHVLNTTKHPYGAYTLAASASDGRLQGGASVGFTIDNRPLLAVTSPAYASAVGGNLVVRGTASPRFPISPGEAVDTLEYRIGTTAAWKPLTPVEGAWEFTWNTSTYAKGYHTVYLRSTKWLDTATASSVYYVDNSPTLAVTSPTAGAQTGGVVTFVGTAQDRYVSYPNDTVDALVFRVDGGAWTPGNLTHRGDGWVDWRFTVDTHLLAKGTHTLSVMGTEDGHSRTITHSFQTDNTPIFAVVAPEPGSSMADYMNLRAYAIDRYPSEARPHVDRIEYESTVFVGDMWMWPNATSPGRVDAEAGVVFLTPGQKTLTFRAYDGMDVATITVTATVELGPNLTLRSGVPRFAELDGPDDLHTYKIQVPTDATELTLDYKSFVRNSGSKLYLRHGAPASNSTYDFASKGDGNGEGLTLTPLTGLLPGTYYLTVQGHGLNREYWFIPGELYHTGDYRLKMDLKTLGGGGIINSPSEDTKSPEVTMAQ